MAVDHNNKYRAMLAARDRAGVLPDSLDQLIRSYWPSRCLLTELDIFTAVGDGATAYQVGAKVSASGRGIEMLLNALVSLKLLTKSEGKYFNTPEAGFAQVTRINLPGLSDLVVGRGR